MNHLRVIPIILFSVCCSSTAHLVLKIGATAVFGSSSRPRNELLLAAAANPHLWTGIALHGVALLTWIYALGRAPLGFVYPFIALGFVFTAFLGWYFQHEVVSPARLSGILLIIVGLLMTARG